MSQILPEQIECLLKEKKEGRHYYLYNKKGTEYFEDICKSEEYYVTRCEHEVIKEEFEKFIEVLMEKSEGGGRFNIVELGCGNGSKAQLIIQRLLEKGRRHFNYFGCDFSKEMLEEFQTQVQTGVKASGAKVEVLTCQGMNNQVLETLFRDDKAKLHQLPTLVIQLGVSAGNEINENNVLSMVQQLGPEDAVLVTFDLIKDMKIFDIAYNNVDNYNFIMNYFVTLNEELEANFDISQFKYISAWDYSSYQMSHYLQSQQDQTVYFKKHNVPIHFFQNENIMISRSQKYNNTLISKMAQKNNLKIVADIKDSKKYITFSMFQKI